MRVNLKSLFVLSVTCLKMFKDVLIASFTRRRIAYRVSRIARRVKEEIIGGLEMFEAKGRYDGTACASTTIWTN